MKFIYLLLLLRISQTLLFHRHQLPEERVGAENVDEPEQEELGGRPHSAGLSAALQVKRIF